MLIISEVEPWLDVVPLKRCAPYFWDKFLAHLLFATVASSKHHPIYIYKGLQLEISNFIEVKNKLKIKDTDLNILHDKISYIEVCTFFSFNLFLTLI